MKTLPDSITCAPTPDEIRAATDRLTTSDVFSRSPQLGAFLRFVVEATLQGKAGRIKAYTIGVEVLRRDVKFDPQIDPIVRVEATRLRRAIERYYAGSGADDPIVIDLPRGSYVPVFRRRELAGARSASIPGSIVRVLGRPHRRAAVALAAGVAIAFAIAAVFSFSRPQTETTGAIVMSRPGSGIGAQLPAGNGMPTILIESMRVIGAPPRAVAGERLTAKISDAFSRFDTINVSNDATASNAAGQAAAVPPRAEYRLSGTIENINGVSNAWFTLTDCSSGNVVWSRTFDDVQPPGGTGITEDSIVIALTNSLLQSYGVIRSRDRALQLATNTGDPRYRCILEAADAIRTANRQMHDFARACLEQLTTADPSFAVGFTFLSLNYNREFQLGYELRPGDPPPLDRALQAVRHSINLNPEGSRGYLALMVIQFNRRDIAAAIAAGEKTLALNKYDMLALGEYGGRLILSGDVARGMSMLHEAGAHGAVRPAWHYVYLFLGSYISGDLVAAARYADQIPNANLALGQVAQALAAKAAGDQARVQQAIDRLIAIEPRWRDDPQGELARTISDSNIVDRLARDLAAAGLSGRS